MRHLATIQKIDKLEPIPKADFIEKATILGWECVVKKGEFKVGEKVIYVEVDSVMPEKPQFEFLRERKFRIKTIKLKKQISQGLVLPIEGNLVKNNILTDYPIGFDVTYEMGVTKYLSPTEQEEFNQGVFKKHWTKKYKITKWLWKYDWFRNLVYRNNPKNDFPHWVSKTDEERIQNIPSILKLYKDKEVYVTEKIDYQSVTFTTKITSIFNNWLGKILPQKYEFIVCSRNHVTNNKNSLYWKIAEKYNIKKILKENPTITIQGEQGNTNVQGNKYGITEPTMWVFNVINHNYKQNYHYNYEEIKTFCNMNNVNLTPVPLIGKFKLSELGSTVQELVEFSKGQSVLSNIQREGVVIRCVENGKKIFSFKVINPDFLLKYDQ